MAVDRRCGTCCWFDEKHTQKGKPYTICRVRPPSLDENGITRWLGVGPNEHCGEWRVKPEIEARSRHGEECFCIECLQQSLKNKDESRWVAASPRVRLEVRKMYHTLASALDALCKERPT